METLNTECVAECLADKSVNLILSKLGFVMQLYGRSECIFNVSLHRCISKLGKRIIKIKVISFFNEEAKIQIGLGLLVLCLVGIDISWQVLVQCVLHFKIVKESCRINNRLIECRDNAAKW